MVIGGAPEALENHAARTVQLAFEMIELLDKTAVRLNKPLALRIGVHSGPVVGGVIGKNKFAYDFWGDTVNTASRMESHGVPGKIHVSEETRREIAGHYATEERGKIEIKGKGVLATHLVLRAFTSSRPAHT